MNSIGERIFELRKRDGLSQGDLADKLNVSRQTVSKWENNSSLPEIDKLVALSDTFSVTTDYIIKGIKEEKPIFEESCTEPKNESSDKSLSGRKIAGIVLTIIGALLFVAFLFYAEMLAMIGAWIVGVGCLLIFCKKHCALMISWLTFIMGERFLRYFTTVSMSSVFVDNYYTNYFYLQLIVAYILWIILLVLVVVTLVTFSKAKKK